MSHVLYCDENSEGKLDKLLEVSNPKEVIMKAIEYFKNPDIKVYLSNRKNKKYMIVHPKTEKMVHFGDINYLDYTKHKDKERREAYLKRASNIKGNWMFDRYSPNSLSLHLLW